MKSGDHQNIPFQTTVSNKKALEPDAMIDDHFITAAYTSMERGFPEFRRRKRHLARRSVIKNFFKVFNVEQEKTDAKLFLFRPKPAIQKIFKDAVILDTEESPFLKNALFYFQLGYVFPWGGIRLFAARKGYKYLQDYFASGNISILNCGPSILSPFLAKLCEDKRDNSRYYILQHGIYQSNYQPYDFELRVTASRSVIWSELLAQHYISLGMAPEKIQVLPNYLFREVKELNPSDKVLIVGESLNKIYPQFDQEYGKKLVEVIRYLKQNTGYKEFIFKKHPRALPSPEFHAHLKNNGVTFSNEIDLKDYGLVIGAVSTFMIEALAEGCRVLQVSFEDFSAISEGDYSLHTSAEIIKNANEIGKKVTVLKNLKENYIKSEFLQVNQSFERYYQRVIE